MSADRCSWWARVCLASSVLAFACHAQMVPPEAEFEAANRLYEQGRFSEAVAAYETLTAAGRTSAAVHYNLANAHFRNGQLGPAVAQYRQALALAPRDPDIQANLRFARQQVAGSASVAPPAWLRALQRLRLDEWTLLTLGGLCLTCGLLILGHWWPTHRRRLRPWILLGAGLTLAHLVAVATLWHHEHHAPLGVALWSDTPVRYGPLAESQVYFTVPGGTELSVEDAQGGWIQVVDAAQRRGWTPSEALWIPGSLRVEAGVASRSGGER